jgi:hypothetical protein
MPFQAVPDTVEFVIDYLMSGKQTANVLHYRKLGGYTQADLDSLSLNGDSILSTYAIPLFTLTQEYAGIRVRGLAFENDVQSANADHAGPGVIEEVALPNNVSLCLTFRTALTGRSARGRFYTQPPHDGDMSGPNTVKSTYRDAWLSVLSHLSSAFSTIGWTQVVVSRQTGGAVRPVGVTYPVTAVLARNLRTDSQRNRMPVPD